MKQDYFLEKISESITFSRKRTLGNASYAYHRHDACEVVLFYEGDIRFYIEQTCFTPGRGSLVVLNPNEMHRMQSMGDAPYERIVLNVKKSYLDELSTEEFNLADCFYKRPLGTGNLRTLSPDQMVEFEELYRKLESSVQDGLGKSIERNAYAALLLLWINRRYLGGQGKVINIMPSYVSGVMQYVLERLDEPICLERLANRFHVSPGYLSAQFKKHTGLTLREYLLDKKIDYAKTLLLQGANVTEACYQAGFGDYANFIRSFKKITGMSPGRFKSAKAE